MKKKSTKQVVSSTIDIEEVKLLFGKRLQALRKENEVSQFNLSTESEINLRNIGKWEAGKTDPQLSSIVRICNAFGITLKQFFDKGFE